MAVTADRPTPHTHSATLRCGRTPPHYRTPSGRAAKKTPLTVATTGVPPRVDLAALYEQLRRRVLDGGRGVPGCAFFQRQGMKSWIESCLRISRPAAHVCPPHTPAAAEIPFCGEFVHLIAVMVLQIHQQGAMS
jgi:hypothetical protein